MLTFLILSCFAALAQAGNGYHYGPGLSGEVPHGVQPIQSSQVGQHVQHAPQQVQYAAQQVQYAAPQVQYAAPQVQYIPPKAQQVTQQAQYAAPHVQYFPPKAQQVTQQAQYASPQVQYIPPIVQQVPQPVQTVAPQLQYIPPNNQHVFQQAQQAQPVSPQLQYIPPKVHNVQNVPQQVQHIPKKTLNVMFLMAPHIAPGKNVEVKINNPDTETETVIYLLSKQSDPSEILQQIKELQERVQVRPEVMIIKYRTEEELEKAVKEVQAKYDNLGGPTPIINGGVASVLDYTSDDNKLSDH